MTEATGLIASDQLAPNDPVVLVFRTMPDRLNSNKQIEAHVASAAARVLVGFRVISVGAALAEQAILELRPVFALGVGGVALDQVDLTAIARAARHVGASLAYWLHDDPYEFDFGWKLRGRCDWVFNTDRASIDLAGTDRTSHLPLAADRDLHIRPLVPFGSRTTDVFFCGYAYPNRRAIIERLRDALSGYQTDICGAEWDESIAFCRNVRLAPDELIEAYTRSRLVLNIGRHFNIANRRFDIVASTPGPRTFEAAAAGCVQVAFLENCEMFDYFGVDREIVAFNSGGELRALLERLRTEPEVFEAIAAAAQARVLAEHTYDHRIETLVSTLETNGIWSRQG